MRVWSPPMSPDAIDSRLLALSGVGGGQRERRDDVRGWESFAHRDAPQAGPGTLAQTIVVRSQRGVLRGTYAHPSTAAHVSLVDGEALLGLHDARPASPTYGRSVTVELGGNAALSAVRLPAGVAYALWFVTDAVHALSSSRAIDPVDEYACRWDDPGLGFQWQPIDPVLSTRDALAGSLNALRTSVAAALG